MMPGDRPGRGSGPVGRGRPWPRPPARISPVNPATLAVGMHGAAGRMGSRIIQLIQDDPALSLGAALDRPDHPRLGEDVGPLAGLGPLGVPLSAALDRPVDVMIDFSLPAGT